MRGNPGLSLDHKAYLFTGESDARRQEAVSRLTGALVDPDFAAFDLTIVDAEGASAQDILSAVTSAPFASKKKVVLVERVDLLDPEDQLKIAEFLPKLGEKSCLIMLSAEKSAPSKSKGKAKEKTAKTNGEDEDEPPKKGLQPKLRNAVKKHGLVVPFEKLKGDALRAAVVQEARSQGREIRPDAAEILAHSVEGNVSLIQREIEKLILYTEDRKTITAADVAAVTPRSAEDRVFLMADAVGAKRTDQAVRMLNETLEASAKPEEEVMRIVSMLARHFRLLYQAVFLKEAGITNLASVPEDIREMLPKDHNLLTASDWARRQLLGQSRFFTVPQVRACLKQVLACELATKGIEGDSTSRRLHLEMLVVRLCQRK